MGTRGDKSESSPGRLRWLRLDAHRTGNCVADGLDFIFRLVEFYLEHLHTRLKLEPIRGRGI